ncbi:MAG: hypothetical protein ABH832_02425 [bacterium]
MIFKRKKQTACVIMVFSFLFLILPLILTPATAQGLNPNSIGIGYGSYTGLSEQDLRWSVISIVRYLLGLLGIVLVVIIMYAGYIWMTAGGNEERVTSAKAWLKGAIIGLIIILSSFAITSWILQSAVNATHGISPVNVKLPLPPKAVSPIPPPVGGKK